jgi:molybdate transport system substrate-binding protein
VKPGTTPEARSGRVVDDRAPRMVRVAAASDLKFVLDDIVARLARRGPPIRIEPVYGSSGAFHAQLVQRAPFDLYLSADIEHPRDLVGRGLADGRDLFTYAVGRLVVWIPRASPLPIERDGIRVLLAARRIAVANPRHAPYGRAAEAAMRTAGIWEAVHSRLVLGETVAQAAQFVQSRAADAGLIARSLAVAPPMRGAGRYWDVPAAHHPPILQGGLVLRKAVERDGAAEVRDFLQSDEGRRLLQSSGFDLPRGDEGSGGLEAARTEASDRASPATNGRRPAQSPRGHAD